ncbi:MAG: pyrroline-5-carboxylate reductase [Nitrososphaerales archaeon]
MKVAIIGGGTMGEALARSFSTIDNIEVCVAEVKGERRAQLQEQGFKTYASSIEAVREAEVVVIAVKPKDVKGVLEEVKELVGGKLIISVAAGVKIRHLESVIPEGRFIRAMPNIAAVVKAAITALTPSRNVGKEDLEVAQSLFSSIGRTILIDESLIDAVTGLSGSGPAYIFLVIEALAEGGLKMGIPYDKAIQLASWVAFGASKMVIESNKDPSELRRRVTTPAGTTIEGLLKLEEAGVRAAFIKAVEAASKRAYEISRDLGG